MKTVYVVRYVDGTPLPERKHTNTLGRWDDFDDAEAHRLRQPNADQLDVFRREVAE